MLSETPHILLVDDNESILETIEIVLKYHSFQVSTATNASRAQLLLENEQPELILLDKVLKVGDGCQICRWIKLCRQVPPIAVIMFSAYNHLKDECLAAGADAFLSKPFDLYELRDVIYQYTKTQPGAKQ